MTAIVLQSDLEVLITIDLLGFTREPSRCSAHTPDEIKIEKFPERRIIIAHGENVRHEIILGHHGKCHDAPEPQCTVTQVGLVGC